MAEGGSQLSGSLNQDMDVTLEDENEPDVHSIATAAEESLVAYRQKTTELINSINQVTKKLKADEVSRILQLLTGYEQLVKDLVATQRYMEAKLTSFVTQDQLTHSVQTIVSTALQKAVTELKSAEAERALLTRSRSHSLMTATQTEYETGLESDTGDGPRPRKRKKRTNTPKSYRDTAAGKENGHSSRDLRTPRPKEKKQPPPLHVVEVECNLTDAAFKTNEPKLRRAMADAGVPIERVAVAAKKKKLFATLTNEQDAEKLINALTTSTFSAQVNVTKEKKLRPTIKFFDVEDSVFEKQQGDNIDYELYNKRFYEDLLTKNEMIKNKFRTLDALKREIKVVTNSKPRNGTVTVSATVSPQLEVLIGRHAFIGACKARVDRKPLITRCFKCQMFGHTSTQCKSEKDVCEFCAGAHKTSTCTVGTDRTKEVCANCLNRSKDKNKITPAVRHTASSRSCPVFMALKNRINSRTEPKIENV